MTPISGSPDALKSKRWFVSSGVDMNQDGSGYCQIKAFPYGEFASGWPSLKLKHRNPRSVLLSRNSSTCKVLLKHGGPPKTSQVLLQVLSFILLQYLILGTVPIFFLDVKIFRLCPYQPYHSRVKTCRQKHRFMASGDFSARIWPQVRPWRRFLTATISETVHIKLLINHH